MDHRLPLDDESAETARARRKVDVLSHLDGALDEHMLGAMQGVWAMLEHAAADAPSHARAVRARMFWESLEPGGAAAAPTAPVVVDLRAAWETDDAPDVWDASDASDAIDDLAA